MYHFAILYPSRKELARALKRIIGHQWLIEGAADHAVSEAIYLRDPHGNGIEIYVDRPQEQWQRDEKGGLVMYSRPLDLDELLKELN